jgi:hypothetical protein
MKKVYFLKTAIVDLIVLILMTYGHFLYIIMRYSPEVALLANLPLVFLASVISLILNFSYTIYQLMLKRLTINSKIKCFSVILLIQTLSICVMHLTLSFNSNVYLVECFLSLVVFYLGSILLYNYIYGRWLVKFVF